MDEKLRPLRGRGRPVSHTSSPFLCWFLLGNVLEALPLSLQTRLPPLPPSLAWEPRLYGLQQWAPLPSGFQLCLANGKHETWITGQRGVSSEYLHLVIPLCQVTAGYM